MFFFTWNEIGKWNNAKNIEFKWYFVVFSYVKPKLLNLSEEKNFKRKEAKKIEVKFYSEQEKNMWNGSNFALFHL
jgi:hypothetical protein